MKDQIENNHWFNFYSKAKVITAITYGRSGLAFFKRVFDQHPELVSITLVFYEYHDLRLLFHDNQKVLSSDFYNWVVGESQFHTVSQKLTGELRDIIRYMGDDPDTYLDRQLVRDTLKEIVFQKEFITRKKALLAMHYAYAVGLGRDVSKLKGIVTTESVKGIQDKYIFDWVKEDFNEYLLIHLARDIKSSYTSLKTVYSNSFGSLYPLAFPPLKHSIKCNSIILWILKNLYNGGNLMQWAADELSNTNFITIKNEDLNGDFKNTMKQLCLTSGINWCDQWDLSDYVPTSMGKKWLGFSAYSRFSEQINNGPLAALDVQKSRVSAPDKKVNNRWSLFTSKYEIMLLEAVLRKEISRVGYKPIANENLMMGKLKMILLSLVPVKGELPHPRWFLTYRKTHMYRDLIIRGSYFFLLPFFYIWSRIYIVKFIVNEEFVIHSKS